jgi:arginine/lysine/ornithine decarboxylase
MRYRILIADNNVERARQTRQRLQQNNLQAEVAHSVQETLDSIRRDVTLQGIISDIELHQSPDNPTPVSFLDFIPQIHAIRREIDFFLFSREQIGSVGPCSALIKGFFNADDANFSEIADRVRATIDQEKIQAPFFDTLAQYSRRATDSWHTPGHSSGNSLRNSLWIKDFYEFFGAKSFAADLSVSVAKLDSLGQPTGAIREAQLLAARAFGARKTFFVTNGTSTANLIVLNFLLRTGDHVVLDRNCHKSAIHGVILSGAQPTFLQPSVNAKFGILGPVPKKEILNTLDSLIASGKRPKLLMLTSCTYDGLSYDLPAIVSEAHARGVKVHIDEAWFGHARFHPNFAPCAMDCGADYATQSTHKTLSAFSQASMIHVNDPDFENMSRLFDDTIRMFTTTSPQYSIIASLDVARKQMMMEGYDLLCRSLEYTQNLRASINQFDRYRALELNEMLSPDVQGDMIQHDPTKVTVDISKTGLSGHDFANILAHEHGIQVEKTTFNTFTILVTLGTTPSKIQRLLLALESISRLRCRPVQQISSVDFSNLNIKHETRMSPREAFYSSTTRIVLGNAVGRVAASSISPYPPGIPVILPGEVFSQEIVSLLAHFYNTGVEIHGIDEAGYLDVVQHGT